MKSQEDKQKELDLRYLRMANIWAENSYCQRRQVGALIVKNKMIISDGYNGTPAGFENVCEDENNLTKPYVLHAEANAITKIARSNNNSEGATMYVTDGPLQQQQRRSDHVRHGCALHRMRQTDHPGRYQEGHLFPAIPPDRRHRPAETGRH